MNGCGGLIDRALSHCVRAPPLDRSDGDDDADTGTDTAMPDDDDDITSLASQQSTPLQQSHFSNRARLLA